MGNKFVSAAGDNPLLKDVPPADRRGAQMKAPSEREPRGKYAGGVLERVRRLRKLSCGNIRPRRGKNLRDVPEFYYTGIQMKKTNTISNLSDDIFGNRMVCSLRYII